MMDGPERIRALEKRLDEVETRASRIESDIRYVIGQCNNVLKELERERAERQRILNGLGGSR